MLKVHLQMVDFNDLMIKLREWKEKKMLAYKNKSKLMDKVNKDM